MIKPLFYKDGKLKIIDQTKLPDKYELIEINNHKDMAEAIKKLAIRGAPAIGIAAAFGLVKGLENYQDLTSEDFRKKKNEIAEILKNTRPTAVNLEWSLNRMQKVARQNESA